MRCQNNNFVHSWPEMTDLKIGQRSVPVTAMEHHVAEEATEALQNVLCLFRLAALAAMECSEHSANEQTTNMDLTRLWISPC